MHLKTINEHIVFLIIVLEDYVTKLTIFIMLILQTVLQKTQIIVYLNIKSSIYLDVELVTFME